MTIFIRFSGKVRDTSEGLCVTEPVPQTFKLMYSDKFLARDGFSVYIEYLSPEVSLLSFGSSVLVFVEGVNAHVHPFADQLLPVAFIEPMRNRTASDWVGAD